MDAITKEKIEMLSKDNPYSAIYLSYQFMDGSVGKECGFIHNDWDGSEVSIIGEWWNKC